VDDPGPEAKWEAARRQRSVSATPGTLATQASAADAPTERSMATAADVMTLVTHYRIEAK
jgi:hypothetical protein